MGYCRGDYGLKRGFCFDLVVEHFVGDVDYLNKDFAVFKVYWSYTEVIVLRWAWFFYSNFFDF